MRAAMNNAYLVENGVMGRVAYGRIAPNEDLVQSVEKLCLAEGFKNAFVRGALGSLVDACMGNRICMTFEVTLEEWLPANKQ